MGLQHCQIGNEEKNKSRTVKKGEDYLLLVGGKAIKVMFPVVHTHSGL